MSISLNTLKQNYNTMWNTDDETTHTYFNMGVFNEFSERNNQPLTLNFSQTTKQANIVDKADDYYLSIIRWNLQSNLPVLIPDIKIKPNKEVFTGETDYEVGLVYTTENIVPNANTYGLVSLVGKNYLGEYKDGEFGFLKQFNINFPPDNSNSVAYDNYDNGHQPNGEGSIYIISNGQLKVFDKVTHTTMFTLNPPSGYKFQFISTDKTDGNFYIGIESLTTDVITYKTYTRTGATTWTAGQVYTTLTKKSDVAGIGKISTNLYEYSTSQSLPVTLYGVNDQKVYLVNDNVQYTNGAIVSPYAIVNPLNGFGFGIGTDNHTNYTVYPVLSPPGSFSSANTTTSIKAGCLWSSQISNELFGMSTANVYEVWNYSNSRDTTPLNVWVSVGEIDTDISGVTAINIDVERETNKLIMVGSDNNIYQSKNPVAQVELTFNELETTEGSQTLGLGYWDSEGVQTNYVIDNASFGLYESMFKRGVEYYVATLNPSSGDVDLTIYSIVNYATISTHSSFDSNMNAMTYFSESDYFGYQNNSNQLKICNAATLATVYTITTTHPVQNMYQLDSTHIAVNYGGSNVYIYKFSDLTHPVIVTMPYEVCDIAVNLNDVSNSTPALFCTVQTDSYALPLAQRIYKIVFGNTNYTTNTQTLIYTVETDKYITMIDVHQTAEQLIFMECEFDKSNLLSSSVTANTLFQVGGYSLSGRVVSLTNYNNVSEGWIPLKPTVYLSQTTSSTHRWEAMTSNIDVKSITQSRSEANVLYGLDASNSRIYKGVVSGLGVTFTLIDEILNTYDYLSNTPIIGGPTMRNIIQKWDASGVKIDENIFDESSDKTSNPVRSSLLTDGTKLYTLYNNLNSETRLSQINTTTLNATTVIMDSQPNNGLVGYDDDLNVVISTTFEDQIYLEGFNPTTLLKEYAMYDPLIDYFTSTELVYPYLSYETTITYNLPSDDIVNLSFIPEAINTALSNSIDYPQNKEQLYSNPYFYIRYVDTFCRMINNAISECVSNIPEAVWAHRPYFQWNADVGKIEYNQPSSTPIIGGVASTAKWYLIVNQPLYNLLSTFRFQYFAKNVNNSTIYPENTNCRYLLDTNILYDGTTQTTGEYQTYIQQISSVQTWSPIQSFVFLSNIIPVEPQMTGEPQNLNTIDPTTKSDLYRQQSLTKVLTDFIVPLTTGVEMTNQIIYYIPSGEYRLVDLIGGNALNLLTFQVYWKDRYGVIHPLTIDAGSSSDLLCMLRKKTYNGTL